MSRHRVRHLVVVVTLRQLERKTSVIGVRFITERNFYPIVQISAIIIQNISMLQLLEVCANSRGGSNISPGGREGTPSYYLQNFYRTLYGNERIWSYLPSHSQRWLIQSLFIYIKPRSIPALTLFLSCKNHRMISGPRGGASLASFHPPNPPQYCYTLWR